MMVLFFMLAILLGATNASRSTFLIQFKQEVASSELLVSTAIAELERNGFHQIENKGNKELQYGNTAIWVRVASPVDGRLELSFLQLRGGCGDNPEVSGARELLTKVRSSLEAQFGVSIVIEGRMAQ
jgi:hypothetical protein